MHPCWLRNFLLPDLSRRFAVRLLLVVLAAVVVFTQVLLPLRIEGGSMEPTYYHVTVKVS